ncbi:MAG: site-specific integrase, partial [Burkholderiales bacterium]|nr:site-specific integrase [Burkholderiales bacterium]
MTSLPPPPDAAPEDTDPLVTRYLAYVRVEKRLAQRTVELYTADLHKLQANARKAGVALTDVKHTHLRRWVAQ